MAQATVVLVGVVEAKLAPGNSLCSHVQATRIDVCANKSTERPEHDRKHLTTSGLITPGLVSASLERSKQALDHLVTVIPATLWVATERRIDLAVLGLFSEIVKARVTNRTNTSGGDIWTSLP